METSGNKRWKKWILELLAICLGAGLSGAVRAQAFIATGTYTGDGIDRRLITGVGFAPDVVIIKGDFTQESVVKTKEMSGQISKKMGGGHIENNRIEALNADGFMVGTDDEVNKVGITYYWVAMKDQTYGFTTGTYSGNGNNNRAITGLGFAPDFVIVMSQFDDAVILKTKDNDAGESCIVSADCNYTNRVKTLDADGFTVGSDADVNASGAAYFYIAGRNYTNAISVGMFTGNGTDNRGISAVGLSSKFLLVKSNSNDQCVFRYDRNVGDASFYTTGTGKVAGEIKALHYTGFTAGNTTRVNKSSTKTFFLGFTENGALSVNWVDFKATPRDNDVIDLDWVTSGEKDCLFYTVERSADNQEFRDIAEVPALASGNGMRYYQASDPAPLSGNNWYRIRETDINGNTSYSNTVMASIAVATDGGPAFSIYPNPTVDKELIVHLEQEPSAGTLLRVIDMNGRETFRIPWPGSFTEMKVRLPQATATGSYFVEVTDGKTLKKQSHRIVIE